MPEYISYLPHLNAILNSTSAILLIAGYRFIRKGRINAHRNCQLTAFTTSTLFLISYLTYHYYHGATSFPGQGIVRPIYFTVLITHTILAVVICFNYRRDCVSNALSPLPFVKRTEYLNVQ